MKNKNRLLFASLITVAFAGPLHAAPETWTNGGDGLWSNTANWGGSAFDANDSAVFGSTTSTTTLNNDLGTGSPLTIGLGGITFNSDAVAYTIGGNRFSVGANIDIAVNSASGVNQTINNAFHIGNGVPARAVTVTGDGDLTLGGAFTRAASAPALNMNGTGVLTISSSASIATNVAFNVNSGTVMLEKAGFFAQSATLTGGLVKQTADNQITSGGSSLMPTVNGGTLDLNGFSTKAAIKGNGGQIVNNGASDVTLTLRDTNTTASFAGAIKDGTTNKIAVVVGSQASSLYFQTLSGTNTYSGGTTITSSVTAGTAGVSTLSIGSMDNIGTSGSRNLNFGGTATGTGLAAEKYLQITGTAIANSNEFNSITFASGSGSGFDIADAGHTYTLSNAVTSGSGGFFKRGAGTLVMTNTNTYTGATFIRGGVLSVATIGDGGVAGNLGQASAAATSLVFDGGTLKYTGANATSNRAFTINALKTATIDTANDISFAGHTGTATTGALTKIGAGTLTLDGINTYTGATTINNGTLKLGTGGSLAASSSVSIAAGGTFDVTALTASSATYTWNTSSLSAGGTATAATLAGTAGGTIAMGSKPITLTYDGTNPALSVTGATLSLNNNPFTVNGASVLANGTYNIVAAAGAITDGSTSYPTPTGTALTGKTASITVSGSNVVLNVSGSPYDTWSGGAPFDADSNGDGVKNGLAWLLGAPDKDANANSRLPVPSQDAGKLVLTFDCLSTTNRGSAVLTLQSSNDLGIADPWSAHEAAVPGTAPTSTIVNGVNFTTTVNGALIHVVAEIPAGLASGGKNFGRLNAVTGP